MPEWERLTAHIEADPESKEKLGWVREMYAFSVATALVGIKLDMRPCPGSLLIAQPPADKVHAASPDLTHSVPSDPVLLLLSGTIRPASRHAHTAAGCSFFFQGRNVDVQQLVKYMRKGCVGYARPGGRTGSHVSLHVGHGGQGLLRAEDLGV